MAQINLSGSIGLPGSQSLLGNVNVVMTNTNHTLSSAEYSNKFLNVTSSVALSVTRNLVAPLNQGQEFVIQNNTTGGQAIQIIGTSGGGITIISGKTVSVICDGANYLLANGSGTPDATIVTYEPTIPLDWFPPPSVVSDALDQLSARSSGGTNAIALQGYPVSTTPPTDGYVLTWDGTDWIAEPGSSGFTAGGDLSGSSTSQTVVGLENTPLLISSLLTGNALQYNGTDWINNPINLAGGGNYVTGILPAGNLPAASTSVLGVIKLSNDLGGTDTSPEVLGLLSHFLPSLTDGYLNWTGSAWALSPISSSVDASAVTYEPGVPGNWNTPPTHVAQGLDELAAATVGIAPTTVIFMPGGTPGGNIYTTESSLATAIAHTSGQIILFFDLSLVSHSYTFTTVGNLNLGMYTTWTDAFANISGSSLFFTNETTLSYPPVELRGDVRIQINQTTNVCTLTQNASTSTFDNSELVMPGPGTGMFVEAGSFTWSLYMYGSSEAAGVIPIADTFNAYVYDNGFLSSSNGNIVTVNSPNANIGAPLYPRVVINGLMTDFHSGAANTISPDVDTATYLLSEGALYFSPGPGVTAWVPIAGQVLDLTVTSPTNTTFPLLLEQLAPGTTSFSRIYFSAGIRVLTIPAGSYNFGFITEWYSDDPGTNVSFANNAISTPFPAKLEGFEISGGQLEGTFHVIHNSNAVTASVSQAGVINPGDTLYFLGVPYVINTFNGTTGIVLTTNYTGTTNTVLAGVAQELTTSTFSAQNIVSQMYDAAVSYTQSTNGSVPFIDTTSQTIEWEVRGASLLNSTVGSAGYTGIIDETTAGSTVTISLYGTTVVGYGLIGPNLLANAGFGSTLKIIVYSTQVVINDPALLPFVVYGYPLTTIVFQPDGTAGGNVYIDEPTLEAAIASTSGPITLQFDLSNVSNDYTFTTVGTLNLGRFTTWTDSFIGTTLHFDNETNLSFPPLEIHGIIVINISQSTAVCTLTQVAGTDIYDNSQIYSTGGYFVDATSHFYNLNVYGSSVISGNATTTGGVDIYLYDGTQLADAGNSDAIVSIYSPGATVNTGGYPVTLPYGILTNVTVESVLTTNSGYPATYIFDGAGLYYSDYYDGITSWVSIGPTNIVTFQPSGTTPGVFTDWTILNTYVQTLPASIPLVVVIDNTFDPAPTVPSGDNSNWPYNVTFMGAAAGSTLTFSSGATFGVTNDNPPSALTFTNLGVIADPGGLSTSVFTWDGGGGFTPNIFFNNSSGISEGSGGSALFSVTSGVALSVYVGTEGYSPDGGLQTAGDPIFEVDSDSFISIGLQGTLVVGEIILADGGSSNNVYIYASSQTLIQNDLGLGGALVLYITSDSGSLAGGVTPEPLPTQSGSTVYFVSFASQVTYVPGSETWTGTPPTDVNDAISRIVTALNGLVPPVYP